MPKPLSTCVEWIRFPLITAPQTIDFTLYQRLTPQRDFILSDCDCACCLWKKGWKGPAHVLLNVLPLNDVTLMAGLRLITEHLPCCVHYPLDHFTSPTLCAHSEHSINHSQQQVGLESSITLGICNVSS
ncbi:hypothetical protein PFLUV_G00215630 [Perca fluviatilis]|uniref:Uncharacterized protein n=1 Tax=Perca fluviatilis TaxID=8168 RepID=A0A6A5DT57_PERFL|nr:hypothetical protein PFLUV_G00215630 [Perca fluviatilis]